MSSARALLARVQRLEQARAPVLSPIGRAWGSFDAFAAEGEADMQAGKLDRQDFSIVLQCLARWEADGTWGAWQRDRIWQLGASGR
jgi:hypothetical protein